LLRAQPGVVTVALHSGAPLLPLAHWGVEKFPANLRRFRRTEFHIRVGRPFRLEIHEPRITRALRRQIADEIMGQIASLRPPEYRGVYASCADTPQYLRYL
jgi:1-acyl-sn-glycerol-3-phosphate acyltransferase